MQGTDEITKETEEFLEASGIRVSVGTNGYQGGDAGHGSRTYFHIEDAGGSDIEITLDADKRGVCIELGGDSELSTFTQALEYAAATLKRMAS